MLGLGRMAFNETGPTGAMVPAWSLATFEALFDDPFTFEITWNSMRLSLASTTLALLLSYPLALFLFRTRSRFKTLMIVLAITPMLVNGVVRVFGWLALLGDRGLVNAALMGIGLTKRAAAPGLQRVRRHHRARREPDALHDPGAAVGLRPARCDGRGGGREPRRARRGACSGA